MENVRNNEEKLMWIVDWNEFLCSLKKTIGDTENLVVFSKQENLENVESIREIIDFKKLFSYLKEHQVEHARAWVFQFEKSMNEMLKFAWSRFNCPHEKNLDFDVTDKFEYVIDFINDQRDTISAENMKCIPCELKAVIKFYKEYKMRIIDFEANVEYRKKYFSVRKGIEQIPEEELFIITSVGCGYYIYVAKEHKNTCDNLFEQIGLKLESYEISDTERDYSQKLSAYEVDFGYEKISYFDFYGEASLSEAIYRDGDAGYIEERAVLNAFEDDDRII